MGTRRVSAEPFLFSPVSSDAPTPRRATLSPPGALSVNLTTTGVVLRWAPPPGNRPPITALVLQSRSENGQWLTLDRDIDAAAVELAVPGLRKVTTNPPGPACVTFVSFLLFTMFIFSIS